MLQWFNIKINHVEYVNWLNRHMHGFTIVPSRMEVMEK